MDKMNKAKGFISEFREFISKGNVMDMAVGIIVGSAFTAIVTSLVNDIIMPIIGLLFGGIDFTNLKVVFKAATETSTEAAFYYGNFIQSVVNFLLISFVIFSIIKFINSFKRKQEEAVEEEKAEEPSEEILLLREIRDSLNK